MSVPANEFRPVARLDLAWIGEAWRLFTAQPGTWVGAAALYLLVTLLIMAAIAVPTGFWAYILEIYRMVSLAMSGGVPVQPNPRLMLLRLVPFSLIMASVQALLYGGMLRMAIRQYRNEEISSLGVFSALNAAGPLILIGLLITAVNLAIEIAIPKLNNFAEPIINGIVFLAPLRVVDKRVGPIQALSDNFILLRGQRWLGLFLYLFLSLMLFLGKCCVVGFFVALPLFILTQGVSYMMMTDPRQPAAPDYGQSMSGVWPPPPNLGQ